MMLSERAVLASTVAMLVLGVHAPRRAEAQRPEATIRIGEDRPLVRDAGLPVVEPHLSAHPADPGQLFVSAIVVKAGAPYYDFDCALFASRDAGTTWTRADLGFGMCGNPWGAVLADGGTAFTALAEPGGILRYRADMRVYRSDDRGVMSPLSTEEFGPGFDYPKLVQDTVHGDVYVVGTRAERADGRIRHSIVVARSSDGGRRFAEPVRLTPSPNTYEAQLPVVLHDGTLLVPFTEHRDAFGEPLPTPRSWLLVSRDRGRTFEPPRAIAEGCSGGAGWAYLTAGINGGTGRDRIYWTCAREGHAGLWLRRSDDRGTTWSAWMRVDQEVDPAAAVVHAIAVNRDGTIGVMWLSRVEQPEPCSRLVFSASVDGGDSFLPPVVVSTEASCPARDPRNAAAHAHRPRSGGDYNGLAAAADGSFHMVWADARDGVYRLRHASALVERPHADAGGPGR